MNETLAPVELFGLTWDPEETPDGYAFAVAHLAAHAIDTETGIEVASS